MQLIEIHQTLLDPTVTWCWQGEPGAAERQHRGYWHISVPFQTAS